MNKNTKIWEASGKPCKDCGKLYHYPTPYLVRTANKAEKNRKEGKCSPVFDSFYEMMKWMANDHAKYINGECVCGDKKCVRGGMADALA